MNDATEEIERDEAEPAGIDADAIRDEVEAVEVGNLPKDEDERTLFRYLRRRQQLATEIVRLKDQTAAMIRSLETAIAGVDHVYEPIAKEIVRKMLKGKKSKSVKTPFGVAGFRAVNPAVVVTDEAAIPHQFKREKVELVISKADINAHFESTGEVPAGCEVKEGYDKFYAK